MIDFTSPDLLADPYPLYHAIRSTQPAVWLDYGNGTAFWMLTRYADCEAALRNPLLGRWDNTVGRDEWRRQHNVEPTPVQRVLEEWMLFRNPPDHTRLRALVTKAFSPRRIEALRERIEVISNELLDRVEAKGSFELIEDYAVRVPVRVISEMMGVPYEDFETFRGWTEGMAGIIDFNPPADEVSRALAAAGPFTAFFTELIERHRRQPQDDLLSALIEAEEQGDTLTEAELLAQCILLLVAGHETTKNLIGNGVLALMQHRDQWDKLRANPALIRNAVEELLRYDSPVQATSRLALADTEINGTPVKQWQTVMITLAAANRDPEMFPEPDALNLERADVKPLSFGAGIHYCVGAPLARLEGQIAINTLVQRFPDLGLTDAPIVWQPHFTLRGLKQLNLNY